MTDTPTIGLPLVAAAQAQKHVTVNEALTRLDALAAAVVSRSAPTPPPTPAEGEVHIVPLGAEEAWGGVAGALAAFMNGGWLFIDPPMGKRAWIVDEGTSAVFDGDAWISGVGPAAFGASAAFALRTLEVALAPGVETVVTPAAIGDKWIVHGVTGRVLASMTGGGATAWRLGVAGAEDRYGAGYGLVSGSEVLGVTGQPLAYYGQTALSLGAIGGAFGGGRVRLCVHYVALTPPRG